jgi:hypothetical protein
MTLVVANASQKAATCEFAQDESAVADLRCKSQHIQAEHTCRQICPITAGYNSYSAI